MTRKMPQSLIPSASRHLLTELGDFITIARREKGLTQAELAERVGVGRMTIVRLEQGAPRVAIGYYLTAAWVLGLPLFAWDDFTKARSDTTTADILERLRQKLPTRIRRKKQDLDNDF